MKLRSRLEKLEAPALVRWREAWQHYLMTVGPHVDALNEPLIAVCDEAQKLGILETTADSRNALDALTHRLGLPTWITSWSWGDTEVPDDEHPNLKLWPHTLASPPPEPPEAWEELEPLTRSEDVAERWCALICLFTLGHARGHREYTQRPHSIGKSADTP